MPKEPPVGIAGEDPPSGRNVAWLAAKQGHRGVAGVAGLSTIVTGVADVEGAVDLGGCGIRVYDVPLNAQGARADFSFRAQMSARHSLHDVAVITRPLIAGSVIAGAGKTSE